MRRILRWLFTRRPIATITTIEGKRHGTSTMADRQAAASPNTRVGQTRWTARNPTTDLWGKRNTSSGHFDAIKRSGDIFKGVKREN